MSSMRRLAVAVMALGTIVLARDAGAEPLTIGTAFSGGASNQMAIALSKSLQNHEDMETRIQAFGANGQYLPLIDSGELAMGTANSLDVIQAVNGDEMYGGRKHANLRLVAASIPFRLTFMVRADSGIRTVADLAGKRIPSELPTVPVAETLAAAMLARGGLTYEDVEAVPLAGFREMHEAFVAGRVDAVNMIVGAGYIAEIDRRIGGLRAVDLGDDAAGIAAMKEKVPVARAENFRPERPMTGVDGPINVMTYDFYFLAGKDVDDDIVYRVTRTLHDHAEELAESMAAFNEFRRERMAAPIGVPFHPGAERFYRERGLWQGE